jgi:hypothetical protein
VLRLQQRQQQHIGKPAAKASCNDPPAVCP